jgi:16S rRNA processing protein RimM
VNKEGFVLIGKILKAHGLGGAVKVCSYAESAKIFEEASRVFVLDKDSGTKKTFKVKGVRPGPGKSIILDINRVENRDQANLLSGCEILIKKSALPELEEDVYYWSDIIGLEVFTSAGQNIGRVESIVATGSNDVYIVRGDEVETLVPALESVVLSVDLDKGSMLVNLPQGL